MPQTVESALKRATLYSDDMLYCFVQLPPNGALAATSLAAEARDPFIALIIDKDEVSLLVPEEDYEEFSGRLRDHTLSENRYRLITFDVQLEHSLFGFMARVSDALADAGISILPFAAYSRDHIFVSADDFDSAIAVLEDLKAEYE
jgi:hypothetical protein